MFRAMCLSSELNFCPSGELLRLRACVRNRFLGAWCDESPTGVVCDESLTRSVVAARSASEHSEEDNVSAELVAESH